MYLRTTFASCLALLVATTRVDAQRATERTVSDPLCSQHGHSGTATVAGDSLVLLAAVNAPPPPDPFDVADAQRLRSKAAVLRRIPHLRLAVIGTVSAAHSAEYSLALATRNAQRVKHMLTSLGVDEGRLVVRVAHVACDTRGGRVLFEVIGGPIAAPTRNDR